MNQESSRKASLPENNKKLIEMVDLEILFINAIAICALLLAVVATDLLLS